MTATFGIIQRLERRYRDRAQAHSPLDQIVGFVQAREQVLFHPIQVQVDLVETCRQSCTFCVQASKMGRTGQWTARSFELLAAELASAGVAQITLSGGEPGCHPDLLRVLECCKHEKLAIRLETTGIDLDVSVLDRLADLLVGGQDEVVLSMDAASADTYRRIRGVDGFERLETLLDFLKRTRIPFSTRTVIVPENVDEVVAIALNAQRHGALASAFGPPHGGNASGATRLPTGRVAASYEALLDLAPGMPLRLDFASLSESSSALRPFRCSAGIGRCSIDASGNVAICNYWMDHGRATGRWEPGKFEELWREISSQHRSLTAACRCD